MKMLLVMFFAVQSLAAQDPRNCLWMVSIEPGGNHLTDAKPGSGTFEEARTAMNLLASDVSIIFHVQCALPGQKPTVDIWSSFRGK